MIKKVTSKTACNANGQKITVIFCPLLIAIHLRWFFLWEKWFQYHYLANTNYNHTESDKNWPDHHPFIEIFSSFATLKRRKNAIMYRNYNVPKFIVFEQNLFLQKKLDPFVAIPQIISYIYKCDCILSAEKKYSMRENKSFFQLFLF